VITHHVPATNCPACGKVLNAATNATYEAEEPAPGDYTVCVGCETPLVFGPGCSLAVCDTGSLTAAEREMVEAAVATLREAKRRLGREVAR